MGVYVYKSKHADLIKVGHYSKTNAWSRIAHRGFYSCITPVEIINKTSVDDLDLIYWFPSLTPRDEKKIHKELKIFRVCGEWFRSTAVVRIPEIVFEENKATECCKEEALNTKRRL
jgi:hypothetical protein